MTAHIEPFAIVGLSFKMAQEVVDERSLWDVIVNRKNLMTDWPENRINLDAHHDGGSTKKPNMIHARGAHFVKEDPRVFDAPFFCIPAREAESIDPQQRWALETVYHALENAGIPVESIRGSRTAVYAASFSNDYRAIISKDPDLSPRQTATGVAPSILPNRISWHFDLRGPSVHVDSACSSSLVALDMACQAMQSGNATMAIIFGTSVFLDPESSISMSSLNFLSPDGRCYSFDSRANGFARGEGVVAIVVKPLRDAINHGDVIRAVIRSTASNQDGRSLVLTQPSSEAQETLIRHAYAKAGIGFDETRYFEAHGTGTPIGDPIEMKAIGQTFRISRSTEAPLYVGSVKANVGHLEAASGLAGVVKSILALEKGIIPPNALFEKLNPSIDADSLNVKVPTQCIPWPTQGLRRASVNTFGFGGTNSHVILDDALHYLRMHNLEGFHHTVDIPAQPNGISFSISNYYANGNSQRPKLFVLSAMDSAALQRMINAYQSYYHTFTSTHRRSLDLLVYTLAARRSMMPWRAFAVVDPSREFNFVKGEVGDDAHPPLRMSKPVRVSSAKLGIAFVFTGQGAGYCGMGRGLLQYPTFEESLRRSDYALASLGCKWTIFDELYNSETINSPEFSQPLCTVLQIALVDLLRAFGVVPTAVVGHSSGEIAAAYAIGALSQKSACKVAYYRGQLAERLRRSSSARPGAMMSVNLSEVQVPIYLQQLAIENGVVHVACVNSPTNVTLSAPSDIIDTLKERLDRDGIFTQKVNTGIAYHSPAMREIAADYLQLMGSLELGSSSLQHIPMVSSVTGKFAVPKQLAMAQYWVDNLLLPVRFVDALRPIAEYPGAITDLIEIGPHPALRRPLKDNIPSLHYHPTLERNKESEISMLELLGTLFCEGYPVSILAGNGQDNRSLPYLVDCPSYPFDHSRVYWQESRLSKDYRLRSRAPSYLLGRRAHDWNPLQPRWRNWLCKETFPWLGHHVISGTTLCPATCMLIMATEAITQFVNTKNQPLSGIHFKDVEFIAPIMVGETPQDAVETVVELRPIRNVSEKESTRSEIRIFSEKNGSWTECFRAEVRTEYQECNVTQVNVVDEAKWEREHIHDLIKSAAISCTKSIDSRSFYEYCEEYGYEYGQSFQLLRDIRWDNKTTSFARIDLTAPEVSQEVAEIPVHPATLDAVLHLFLAQYSKGITKDIATVIPHHISDMWISSKAWNQITSTVSIISVSQKDNDRLSNLYGISDDGSLLCTVKSQTVAEVSSLNKLEEDMQASTLLHSISWKPQLSSLSAAELQQLCDTGALVADESTTIAHITKVEMIMKIAARKAVKEISNEDLDQAPRYMRKLMASMEHQYGWREGEPADPDDPEFESLLQECESEAPELRMFPAVARNLPSIIRSRTDPLELLFNTKAAESFYAYTFGRHIDTGRLKTFLGLLSHESPGLRILEVGAGTGSVTELFLSSLHDFEEETGQSRFLEYVYTDVSPSFFEGARERFGKFQNRIIFKTLDLEVDLSKQGFNSQSYDLVVAGGVLHVCSDLTATLKKVHKLLKPGGHLALLEHVKPSSALANVGFGVLEGWWSASEEWRRHSPLVTEQVWDVLLSNTGFTGIDVSFRDAQDDTAHINSIMISTALEMANGDVNHLQREIIVINPESEIQRALAAKIAKDRANTEVLDMAQIDKYEHTDSEPIVVVSLLEVGVAFFAQVTEADFNFLQSLVARFQNILWISLPTCTGNTVNDSQFALATGFWRAIRSEQSHKCIANLTFESWTPGSEVDFIENVLRSCFGDKPACTDLEFIVRHGQLTIGRLEQESRLDEERISRLRPKASSSPWGVGPPITLEVAKPGMLDTLRFVEDSTSDLGPDEIEIKAATWPVSFRDVFIALGRLDNEGLGFECAGTISRVGASSPAHLCPGDRVVMISPGCMRSHPRAPHDGIFKIPDSLSFHDAVAAMNPGTTAYHALVNVARLQPGEKVLIHSAAGSTGQMAVKIAQMVGAEVFATVGSDEKKELITNPEGLNIPASHVFNSRNTLFAKGIMRITGGYGVDVVLNSLSGDALRATWECIAPYGRFIEIGKADIKANASLPMAGFAKNVSFAAVDLHHIALSNRKLMRQLVERLLSLIIDGKLSLPSPLHVYAASEVERAFRYMQSGKNTGRIIINLGCEDVVLKHLVKKTTWRFETDATYIVAGGLGGLGRTIVRWMVERGARNLIIPSRSGVSSQAASEVVAQLTSKGINVVTPRCDVSSAKELAAVLRDCAHMPPIKGCINSAMVLQDAIFENMTYAQWSLTIHSKVQSSWNLHQLLPRNLDFFILLSSLAGIYGSPAQCNYAAGCSYQDALTKARTIDGFGGVSTTLDLGWMYDIGIIAEHSQYHRNRQEIRDMAAVYGADLLALLDHYCDPTLSRSWSPSQSQLLVGSLTPQDYYSRGREPVDWARRPLFAGFDVIRQHTSIGSKDTLSKQEDAATLFREASSPKDRTMVVVKTLKKKLAHALGVQVEDIDPRQNPSDYGVDSLMAVELRNWIWRDFGVKVAVFEILGRTAIEDLAGCVAERAG